MSINFEPPPKKLSLLVCAGGIATAIAAIASLESLSNQPDMASIPSPEVSISQVITPKTKENPKLAKLDAESVKLPGTPVTSAELKAAERSIIPPGAGTLTPEEMAMAEQAWEYFEYNWNDQTGLVNSVDGFASVTMWDQGAAIAALVSANELEIIPESEFKTKMSRLLKTLATMPLYKDELPNKVYNAKTLMPVDYGQLDKKEEIGWSAIDLGRLALWLKIVGAKYPEFKSETEAVWDHWQVERLTDNNQMYGTSVVKGKEQYNQEGRLGYENYAAYGLKLWELNVKKALDFTENVAFVDLYGQGVPYDKRDYETSEANNYVLSEPYILDGIETGFKALPKAYADRLLAAQESRYNATNQLTAITEDNLDRPPYFVYGTLFANGEAWATITDTRENHDNLRFISTKAALGWHVLYNTDYTNKLFEFVQYNLKADKGWYNGFYESLDEPNKSLTANNNGVILELFLYKKVGEPLIQWAGVKE